MSLNQQRHLVELEISGKRVQQWEEKFSELEVEIEQLETKSQSKAPETGISFKIGKDKPQLCGWILDKSDSKPTITGQCTKGIQKEYMGRSSN